MNAPRRIAFTFTFTDEPLVGGGPGGDPLAPGSFPDAKSALIVVPDPATEDSLHLEGSAFGIWSAALDILDCIQTCLDFDAEHGQFPKDWEAQWRARREKQIADALAACKDDENNMDSEGDGP